MGWKGAQTLEVVEAAVLLGPSAGNGRGGGAVAVLCATLDEVRTIAARVVAARGGDKAQVRAVLAQFIPSGVVAFLSGLGVAAFEIDATAAKGLQGGKAAGKSISLPAPAQWGERESTSVSIGSAKVSLTWLALGVERAWAGAGTATPSREPPKVRVARS